MLRGMTTCHHRLVLLGFALAGIQSLAAQTLDDAEVRLPYRDLKQLLANAGANPNNQKPVTPPPALLGSRLRFGVDRGQPFLEATCRVTSFSDSHTLIPLLGGDFALEKSEPAEAIIITRDGSLCLATSTAGIQAVTLRLLPSAAAEGFTLTLPACPSLLFETAEMPDGRAVELSHGDHEEVLGSGQVRPLPSAVTKLRLKWLDERETRAALSPPEPSTWNWQHQALVMPDDDGLIYQLVCRAAAPAGSGVAAMLPLPPDAREIAVTGDDLLSHSIMRGEDRSLALALAWGTRGVLDRRLQLSYRMPLGPLDRTWRLQAPGGGDTRTRFIIATHPLLDFAAPKLSPPCQPQGLPADLTKALAGSPCHLLEAAINADLTVTPVPVAATAEGVVTKAEWSLKIEPDGAMLATGMLGIDHQGPFDLTLDTPEGMKLLSCEMGGKPVSPVDLGEARLKLSLPANSETTGVKITFTGRVTALDPVAGTLRLALPQTPVFIHSLTWSLELPGGYQAETHGNLKRSPQVAATPASRILLTKNLCRDERPEIQVFYQRADLTR